MFVRVEYGLAPHTVSQTFETGPSASVLTHGKEFKAILSNWYGTVWFQARKTPGELLGLRPAWSVQFQVSPVLNKFKKKLRGL